MADHGHLRAVVWVGHVDPEWQHNTIAVVIDCEPFTALDHEERGGFSTALDGGIATPPGVGFYVWEGDYQWYDNRGSVPDGECGCFVGRQSWRPARAVEVWAAQANAKRSAPPIPTGGAS